ncbi:MAG: hypothetical protein Q9187_006255 [Circinaria calcarea]
MALDEVSDIMDNTCNSNETAAVLRLVLVVVPFHYRKSFKRNTPVKSGTLLIELLLLLLNAALFDFVLLELFEVVGEAELFPNPDGPFGRIILVPFNSIAVVGWELVMEVVISFAEGDKCSDDMIPRRVAVVKCLLNEEDPEDSTVYKSTKPVTPSETADKRWQDQAHEEDYLQIVLVLPYYNRVFIQVRDISAADPFRVLLHQHPTKV